MSTLADHSQQLPNDAAPRLVRRNRVNEALARVLSVIAAGFAVAANASPTGGAVADAIVIAVAVGVTTWAAASASWWALTLAAGVATATALDPVLVVVGATGVAGGLMIGVRRNDLSWARTLVAGLSLNVLIRSELGGFFGLSAIVGIGVGAMLFVTGLGRRPSRMRRLGWIGVAVVGGTALAGLALLSASVVSARDDLTNGTRFANDAIASVNAGDYDVAVTRFADAAGAFDRVDDRLTGLLALPSRLVPAVAQNVRAAATLADEAAAGAADAADALRTIDPSTLTVADGAIDIDAIRAVEEPLTQVYDAVVGLRTAVDGAASPWLLDRFRVELAELDARIDDNEPRLANAISAVQLAPQLLGADGERRYLVLLTTPSELRGMTGFAGSYAELTANAGRLALGSINSTSDLNNALAANEATCADCPPEYVARYGRFSIATGVELAADSPAWSNITIGSHFPDVARTAQELYPQSGGADVDGVIALDPHVFQALMAFTGAIAVPQFETVVQPDTAAEFLLHDQYALEEEFDNQQAALETLGEELFARLLAGFLPAPAELARELGPLADENRLLFWTENPDELALLGRIGLTGGLPEAGDDGGFSVFVANGGNSKIDYFLRRDVAVSVNEMPDGGRRLVADVTLANGAPTAGEAEVVLRNSQGLPFGSSRPRLTFYGPGIPIAVSRDGVDMLPGMEHLREAGWIASSSYDVIGPGETVAYRVVYELGPDGDGTVEPVVWEQPLAGR